jgi:hypothetical protein
MAGRRTRRGLKGGWWWLKAEARFRIGREGRREEERKERGGKGVYLGEKESLVVQTRRRRVECHETNDRRGVERRRIQCGAEIHM